PAFRPPWSGDKTALAGAMRYGGARARPARQLGSLPWRGAPARRAGTTRSLPQINGPDAQTLQSLAARMAARRHRQREAPGRVPRGLLGERGSASLALRAPAAPAEERAEPGEPDHQQPEAVRLRDYRHLRE